MPQKGERKTVNGVTGEWDGQTWREVQDTPSWMTGSGAVKNTTAALATAAKDIVGIPKGLYDIGHTAVTEGPSAAVYSPTSPSVVKGATDAIRSVVNAAKTGDPEDIGHTISLVAAPEVWGRALGGAERGLSKLSESERASRIVGGLTGGGIASASGLGHPVIGYWIGKDALAPGVRTAAGGLSSILDRLGFGPDTAPIDENQAAAEAAGYGGPPKGSRTMPMSNEEYEATTGHPRGQYWKAGAPPGEGMQPGRPVPFYEGQVMPEDEPVADRPQGQTGPNELPGGVRAGSPAPTRPALGPGQYDLGGGPRFTVDSSGLTTDLTAPPANRTLGPGNISIAPESPIQEPETPPAGPRILRVKPGPGDQPSGFHTGAEPGTPDAANASFLHRALGEMDANFKRKMEDPRGFAAPDLMRLLTGYLLTTPAIGAEHRSP